jgi:putative holliday junction resolvase
MRYMGIDYGSKNVGISLSDEGGSLAFPKEVLSNDAMLVPRILDMLKAERVGEVVIGHSLNNQGEENPIMKGARKLGDVIKERAILPVFLEPEFYSSQQAERIQGDHDILDASAAAIILNSYLQKKNPKSVLEDSDESYSS